MYYLQFLAVFWFLVQMSCWSRIGFDSWRYRNWKM